MAQESEEKQLPATEKKLRDARRKGQVPQSRDLAAGFSIFAILLYLLFAWPGISDRFVALVETVTSRQNDAFADASTFALHEAYSTVFAIMVPVVGIAAAAVIIFGIFATGGPVFSFDPVKPRFEKINPAQGFKRIMSLRNVVEFAKSMIKVVLLTALLAAILLAWLQALFEAPGCGASCLRGTMIGVLSPLLIAVALAFVLIGIFDVPIQRALFRRDMRMTRTEFKRERRDLEGDPLIRQELRRQRREAVTRPVKRGIEHASLVLHDGDRLTALRYVAGETPVPVIVAMGQGDEAATLLSQARRQGCPVAQDAAFIDAVFVKGRVGRDLETDLFPLVAHHLVRLNLV